MDNDGNGAANIGFQVSVVNLGSGGSPGRDGPMMPPSPRADLRGPFAVGERVEALLGPTRVCTGGVVLSDFGNGTYRVRFDDGNDIPAVQESLLCREVSRVAELEMQLAQLQWRKMQNDAQIRTAIEQTRQMQEQDLMKQLEHDRSAEKAEWTRNIIEDELSRPLEVTEAFMQNFEAEEAALAARQAADKKRHLRGVQRLAHTVEQRGESAAETAARLSAQAAAQQQVAAEVHTKIIKTKHVLSEDYWSLREDELDDGDRASMALLEKRVELLNETWVAERHKAELYTRKASQARANLAALVPGGRQLLPLGSVASSTATGHSFGSPPPGPHQPLPPSQSLSPGSQLSKDRSRTGARSAQRLMKQQSPAQPQSGPFFSSSSSSSPHSPPPLPSSQFETQLEPLPTNSSAVARGLYDLQESLSSKHGLATEMRQLQRRSLQRAGLEIQQNYPVNSNRSTPSTRAPQLQLQLPQPIRPEPVP